MTGSLSPLQTRWLWLLRCLLVTDKFLNKIIRFGALQSALLDYWLSTKISCPADTRVCSQHSKWAKTDLGRGEGVGAEASTQLHPKSLPASSVAEDHPWAPTCRPLQCHSSAVPEPRRPRKQRSISRPWSTKAQEAAFQLSLLCDLGQGSVCLWVCFPM